MSLRLDIRINEKFLATVFVHRRESNGDGPDAIHGYEWELLDASSARHGGWVRHRHGDGAAVLAAKVLTAASYGLLGVRAANQNS